MLTFPGNQLQLADVLLKLVRVLWWRLIPEVENFSRSTYHRQTNFMTALERDEIKAKCDDAKRDSAVYFCRVLRETRSSHQPKVRGFSGSRSRKQGFVTELGKRASSMALIVRNRKSTRHPALWFHRSKQRDACREAS